MPKPKRPYSRVYWEAIDDPKFAKVWDHDGALACWLRLLVAADMAWPASASIPYGTRKASLDILIRAGLIDLVPGSRYRVHGLDPERQSRVDASAAANDIRWHGLRTEYGEDSDMAPGGDMDDVRPETHKPPAGVSNRLPSRDEQSKDEQSKAETSHPLTPAERGHGSPRTNGTNPRAVAAREAEASRERSRRRQQAYLRGDITEAELSELRAADAVPVTKGAA